MKVSSEILNLKAYKPGMTTEEAQRKYGRTDFIKLASNESPFSLPDSVKKLVSEELSKTQIYPDPTCFELKKVWAQRFGCEETQLVFGNGSNELIDLLIRAFCEPGDQVLTGSGAFMAYKICAQAARVKTIESPMTSDGRLNLQDFSKQLESSWQCPKLVFIPNPNNPTGTYVPGTELFEFLDKWGGRDDFLIVLDEAYNEFVTAPDFPKVDFKNYKNVCRLRTLSKVYGLAGLRLGGLEAPEFVIEVLDKIRNPFNVNHLAQVAAGAVLQDKAYLEKVKTHICSERTRVESILTEKEVSYLPSQANFVLIDLKKEYTEVHEALLKSGIIMRPVANYGYAQHLRMTIGTKNQNTEALNSLLNILGHTKEESQGVSQ